MKTLIRLSRLALDVASWPARVADHRRALAALSSLDDRELADIGLMRQDLRDVTALPLGADPTLPLAERAQERAKNMRGPRVLPPKPPSTRFREAAE
jgi:uncharacterized protein YjiS (DUF1127 family)